MVEPVGFAANPETAADNAFQRPVEGDLAEVRERARAEFDAFAATLRDRGVEVEIATPADDSTPDAVFPNNWFSTRPDGTLVLYPMRPASRRRERRPEIVEALVQRYGSVIDFSDQEGAGRFLEGTGSLVIDEPHRIVYASVSSRTDPELVADWAERFGYDSIMFRALDREGVEIYHTNVMMTVGTGWAAIASQAIESDADRGEVLASLAETGHETIDLTVDQMHEFCGNLLELETADGGLVAVMSDRAHRAFRPEQISILEKYADVVHVDLTTIETHGGGSARCMLAELH